MFTIPFLRLRVNNDNILQKIKSSGGSAVGKNTVFVIFISRDSNILLLQVHKFFLFSGFNIPFALFPGYYQRCHGAVTNQADSAACLYLLRFAVLRFCPVFFPVSQGQNIPHSDQQQKKKKQWDKFFHLSLPSIPA